MAHCCALQKVEYGISNLDCKFVQVPFQGDRSVKRRRAVLPEIEIGDAVVDACDCDLPSDQSVEWRKNELAGIAAAADAVVVDKAHSDLG